MYGYGVPAEEGDKEGEEEEGEGAESVEEEEDRAESEEAEPEEGNSPPTTTSQTSTNPSSPSPPPPPSSSSHHNIETSHKKSSKSILVDSEQSPVNAPGSPDVELDLVQDIVEGHDILAEEVEIEEHPADLPGSASSSSSVLGKHPRSEGEGPGDDTIYRDVMLSSRTALEGTYTGACSIAYSVYCIPQ